MSDQMSSTAVKRHAPANHAYRAEAYEAIANARTNHGERSWSHSETATPQGKQRSISRNSVPNL